MKEKINYLFLIIFLIGILFIALVLATAPTWVGSNINYTTLEDSTYYHNLSTNITGFNDDVIFAIDTLQTDIYWTNEDGRNVVAESLVSLWISIINSSTGNLKINATHDNQTGFFEIPIEAKNITDNAATTEVFEFIINATNDVPSFVNLETEYNLSQNENFLNYTNALDEEEQYPLFFNISFYNNCSLASWSTRTNCSIFSLANISNTSAIMNFTPTRNDVGIYWANVTLRDWGENYPCPHAYCDNSTYQKNKTTSSIVMFNVFATLDINVTNCENKIFQEDESGACEIIITTRGETDAINISSQGSLRNYAASVPNSTWFYSENSTTADNFTKTIFVNVTPQKTEIGNWTINLTVKDTTYNQIASEIIYVYVNRTANDNPDLIDITNLDTSVDLTTTIDLTVYDDDLLIPDKLEGYNETITFNVTILNQSDLAQELSITGFDVEILNMPVEGTNRTEAKIEFNVNSSEAGNYTINITINDEDNFIDSDLFNLSIISNNYPAWNQTEYSFDLVVNSSFANTSSFGPINLTGDGYVVDVGDILTFTNDSNAMPSFNLTSTGMIVFTPYKQDVGSWNITITATDPLGLQNATTFRFNVTNVNSKPDIKTPLTPTNNVSMDANSNMNVTEDNYTVITLFIQDEDFRIASAKKDYYNESLTINLTIGGNNTNLFTFVKDSSFPVAGQNQSKYTATFTPQKTDVGNYNISINVTDASGASDLFEFNLTVNGVNDFPILTDLVNQTTAVNRSFYYDINASDEEDGADTQGNINFTYSFLYGTDIFNATTFNSTSGEINITFNSSQGGKYQINITVNDSANLKDSQVFWIYVYDIANITYPSSEENFNLQENVTSNLTFRANHSVQDNLTYEFYLNNTLKYNITYYGNNTNLTWQFTPNYTDETYGENQNLTLIVYSPNSNLENKTDLNYTINWNLNITHTNSPVTFNGYIGDTQTNYDQNIQIDLTQYFADIDYDDVNYNQTINFTVSSGSSPSYISSSISSDWILTLSSLIAVSELLNITANDSSSTSTSNNFQVEFTTPSTITVPTPSSGSSTTIPVSLKILMPDPVSAYQTDKIVLPLSIYNNGQKTLSRITLSSVIVKNNIVRDDILVSFDKIYLASLAVGQKEEVIMTIDVDTEESGTFEITINASVESPKYNDWGKLYLTIKEGNTTILERLVFTHEFLQENPECIELEELLDEARIFFESGDFINTVLKIQEAINGCKDAISQQARIKRKNPEENVLYKYLLISTILVFFLGLGYYSYKRMKLRRSSGSYFRNPKKDKTLFNKKMSLVFAVVGSISVLAIFNRANLVGFAVNEIFLDSKVGLSFAFIFVMSILGFLFLLNRKKRLKRIQEKKFSKDKYGNF